MSPVAAMIRRVTAMSVEELRYRISRRVTLVSMHVRAALPVGLPFHETHDPASYSFCRQNESRLPSLPWSSVTASIESKVPTLNCEWHASIDTGQRWPLIFFSKIRHAPGNPIGDVQLVWTRSRLQELVTLGLLCRESASEDVRLAAGAEIGRVLQEWLSQNPWPLGVHYQSTMECALRLIAVCHAFDLARRYVTSEAWQGLLFLVESHAYFIARRLCLYSSAGNHTIGEAAGLIYAGVLFPEMAEAQTWLSLGLHNIECEADAQILGDGGNRERSFRYLALITDLCGLVTSLLKHAGLLAPSAIERAWKRGMAFQRSLANSVEHLPSVGDSDDGYALSPYLQLSWPPHEDNQLLLPNVRTWAVTGYSKVSGMQEHGTAHFIHGALGAANGFGHGHADALSVSWERGGRFLLADPGTYLYEGAAKYRNYFRGTMAHNTVRVDTLDQARQGHDSPFDWARPYSAELVWQGIGPDGRLVLLARHDGYSHLGVIHWRALVYSADRGWAVWDRLTGAAEHLLELHWHIDADLAATSFGFVIADGVDRWRLRVDGGAVSVSRGDDVTPSGWISRRYGAREPLSTIKVSARVSLPHEFVTTLNPGAVLDGNMIVDGRMTAALRGLCG